MRTQGVQQRQLYRQLVAFRLNCVMSGEAGNCDALVPMASACDALCAAEDFTSAATKISRVSCRGVRRRRIEKAKRGSVPI